MKKQDAIQILRFMMEEQYEKPDRIYRKADFEEVVYGRFALMELAKEIDASDEDPVLVARRYFNKMEMYNHVSITNCTNNVFSAGYYAVLQYLEQLECMEGMM